jgi:hypothetical protein
MFTYILKMIREFEKAHGRRPQLVCLNPRQMQLFMKECPDLFDKDKPMPLSFRILILPESELPHPKAVWMPPRKHKVKRGPPDPKHELQLIKWTARKRTEA